VTLKDIHWLLLLSHKNLLYNVWVNILKIDLLLLQKLNELLKLVVGNHAILLFLLL
jgi:hypothetical protein